MGFDTTQTVREIVQQHPAAVPVFEALGIDYCCGGGRSLEEACRKGDIPLERVISEIADALIAPPRFHLARWMSSSLGELSDYIVEQHHAYVRRELGRLGALVEKVVTRQGSKHPELGRIRDFVDLMTNEMLTHMFKEEQILFPRLKAIEQAASNDATVAPAFFGSVISPIRHMMSDHDDTGELLRLIRLASNDYHPPEGACMSYQALYRGLVDLEKGLAPAYPS